MNFNSSTITVLQNLALHCLISKAIWKYLKKRWIKWWNPALISRCNGYYITCLAWKLITDVKFEILITTVSKSKQATFFMYKIICFRQIPLMIILGIFKIGPLFSFCHGYDLFHYLFHCAPHTGPTGPSWIQCLTTHYLKYVFTAT